MRNDAVLINDIGDPAGKTSLPSAIRLAQDMVCITQQREGQASVGGEGFIVCNRVKTGPENLYVALRQSVIEITEPAPFGGSASGVGFGIKPQHNFLAAQICQVHAGTIVRGDGKIRCLGPDCQHLRPPQEHAKPMSEQRKQRHTWPYDGLCRCWMLSATSNNALARFITGTSITLPSNEVAPLPARSASSKAATTRLA